MYIYAALALLLLAAVPARADEQPVELKPGPGQELTQNICNVCHSLDYIRMNAPFLNADGWKAEVTKMRAAFAAPIEDADAEAIQKYLATHYGAAGQ
jgi:sulfite dehydrogenase